MPSKLKQQVKAILATISSEAQKISDRRIKARYYKIKRIVESPKDISRICRVEGVSRGWFYKWGERLVTVGQIGGLFENSKRPVNSPKKTSRRTEQKICKIRRAQPFLGAERIQDDLKRLYKTHCAVSTINNILRRYGLIGKEKSKALTKRHLGNIKKPMPGYFQMDFKYVPYLVQGRQYYQLSSVDHQTSWRFIRIYPEKSGDYVLQFLREFKENSPIPIFEIQTDNDAAFTDKYTSKQGKPTGNHLMDQWCRKNEVVHKLIPLGEKELNGKVENTHKQDDREFYSQVRCLNESSLKLASLGYNDRWNSLRRTKRLDFKTPGEVVRDSYAAIMAILNTFIRKYQPNYSPLILMDELGNTTLPIRIPKKVRKKLKNKTSKKTYVDRYIQYLEWEKKNGVG